MGHREALGIEWMQTYRFSQDDFLGIAPQPHGIGQIQTQRGVPVAVFHNQVFQYRLFHSARCPQARAQGLCYGCAQWQDDGYLLMGLLHIHPTVTLFAFPLASTIQYRPVGVPIRPEIFVQ